MQQPRILIVDDQKNWRDVLKDLLESDYDLTFAEGYSQGTSAVVSHRTTPFHVAIVDIRLDDNQPNNEDGLNFAEQLKQTSQVTNVIILTGYFMHSTSRRAWRDIKVWDYLEKNPEDGKGFNVKSFREIVRQAAFEKVQPPSVFVVMPFAEEYLPIYTDVIKKTVQAKGLICRRADDFHASNWIIDDIRKCIREAEFLIADFSGGNANVFHEVGMAHSLGKPVLLLTQTPDDIPVSLRQVRYIGYRNDISVEATLGPKLAQAIDELKQDNYRADRILEHLDGAIDPNLCFSLTSPNERAQKAYKYIVEKVASEIGLICEAKDAMLSNQRKISTIWRRLNQARIIVSDLSGRNPEVLYFTGASHGLGKSAILMAQDESDVPFNLKDLPYILYEVEPLANGKKAQEEFRQRLQQLLAELPSQSLQTVSLAERGTSTSSKPVSTGGAASSKSSMTLSNDLTVQPEVTMSVTTRSTRQKARLRNETYLDFLLHIGPDGHARAASDEGEREATISLIIPEDIGLTIDLIEQRKTNETLLKGLGKRLYQIIFPAAIDKHLNQTEAVARSQGRKLRIRLNIEHEKLARLPWEFLYRENRGHFLAINPDTVLSHYLNQSMPPGYVRRREGPLHMLAIVADPTDQTRLHPDEWETIIKAALAGPMNSGQMTLQTVKHATRKEIYNALLQQKPDIIQFVGHGIYQDGKGYLALVDEETGKTWLVDDERFANLYLGYGDHLGLISLATCESAKSEDPQGFLGIAPQLVERGGVPAVIAMRYKVLIKTAKIFLENFYTSVAAGKPIDWAAQSARNAISLELGFANREFATPVLFMRAKDGNIF